MEHGGEIANHNPCSMADLEQTDSDDVLCHDSSSSVRWANSVKCETYTESDSDFRTIDGEEEMKAGPDPADYNNASTVEDEPVMSNSNAEDGSGAGLGPDVEMSDANSSSPAPSTNSQPPTSPTTPTTPTTKIKGGKAAKPKVKRFVGVRQRPSGRWVAEIKDSTQKIRLWLGTYDNAEEAARAYDEAARALRGANTRTNFSPSTTNGRPDLPSKAIRLLLQKAAAAAAARLQPSCPGQNSFVDQGSDHRHLINHMNDATSEYRGGGGQYPSEHRHAQMNQMIRSRLVGSESDLEEGSYSNTMNYSLEADRQSSRSSNLMNHPRVVMSHGAVMNSPSPIIPSFPDSRRNSRRRDLYSVRDNSAVNDCSTRQQQPAESISCDTEDKFTQAFIAMHGQLPPDRTAHNYEDHRPASASYPSLDHRDRPDFSSPTNSDQFAFSPGSTGMIPSGYNSGDMRFDGAHGRLRLPNSGEGDSSGGLMGGALPSVYSSCTVSKLRDYLLRSYSGPSRLLQSTTSEAAASYNCGPPPPGSNSGQISINSIASVSPSFNASSFREQAQSILQLPRSMPGRLMQQQQQGENCSQPTFKRENPESPSAATSPFNAGLLGLDSQVPFSIHNPTVMIDNLNQSDALWSMLDQLQDSTVPVC